MISSLMFRGDHEVTVQTHSPSVGRLGGGLEIFNTFSPHSPLPLGGCEAIKNK